MIERDGHGFDRNALEATHLTDPDKLGTLLALVAFAVVLTVKTGVAMARLHPMSIPCSLWPFDSDSSTMSRRTSVVHEREISL